MVRVRCDAAARRAVLAWLMLGESALAQTASPEVTSERERVRLVYESSEPCAEREQFLARVRARLGTDWEAPPGQMARTIRVAFMRNGQRYVARIDLDDARGRHVARAVAGDSCEQVVEGIALIAALAIEAQLEELVSRTELPPVTPAEAPPSAAPSPTPSEPDPPAASRPPPEASPSRQQVRLGGRALVLSGAGPSASWGGGAFAGVSWQAFAIGLSLDLTETGLVNAKGINAQFTLYAARLEACGRWPLHGDSLSLEPCVYAQAGQLDGRASEAPPEVVRAETGSTLWLAPGVLIALRSELEPIFLGLEAAASAPLNQETFGVDTGAQRRGVYQVTGLSLGAALGAGVTF